MTKINDMKITGKRYDGIWEICIICSCGFEHVHFQGTPKIKMWLCPSCGKKIKNYDTARKN